MLSAMTAAYLAANTENPLEAAAASVAAMGLCGEIAFLKLLDGEGNSTYRNRIIDAVYNLSPDTFESGAKYEIK